MQIMSILGSPRAKGNTAHVLAWVEEELRRSGHEVDHVHIMDHAIQGCRECFGCRSGESDLCVVQDDANMLFRRIFAADAVIIAAPVFCWGFPAQMKALLDRMFCFMDDGTGTSKYARCVQGKPFGLVVTAGGPEENNADALVRAFEAMADYAKLRSAGHLMVADCAGLESLDAGVKKRAIAFARQLTV